MVRGLYCGVACLGVDCGPIPHEAIPVTRVYWFVGAFLVLALARGFGGDAIRSVTDIELKFLGLVALLVAGGVAFAMMRIGEK
jgi:hypothetical protein